MAQTSYPSSRMLIHGSRSLLRYSCGTINRTLTQQSRKETKLKFYKVLTVPVFYCMEVERAFRLPFKRDFQPLK